MSSPRTQVARPRSVWLVRLGALLAGAALSAGLAVASGTSATLKSASNATLGETIVVDSGGRTVYVLSPETRHHLLCKSARCFNVWPPVTVHSRSVKLKAGAGVDGHLALLRRSDGKLQVTLRGLPLYRYSGDTARGQANGQDIQTFGGTWHALAAQTAQTTTSTATTTTMTTTMTTSTTPYVPPLGY